MASNWYGTCLLLRNLRQSKYDTEASQAARTERKDEWNHVLSGRLLLSLANDDGVIEDRELGLGDGAPVPVLRTHRYAAIETATLIEVSTPELDDVARIQDDFGREGTSVP